MAKVLIVEDDAVIADGMARHLGAAGFDPLVVARGELGLARLRYDKPDVCVLDLMLPGLDGWNVIERARAEGIDAEGPLPADTAFFRARRGDFDLVVAMYHDQGHGPVKVLGIEAGVNITVGLPVIRTSVDHGTAFDIAGTGKVEVGSMVEALRQAAQMASSPNA